jgi:hypothetical protein
MLIFWKTGPACAAVLGARRFVVWRQWGFMGNRCVSRVDEATDTQWELFSTTRSWEKTRDRAAPGVSHNGIVNTDLILLR